MIVPGALEPGVGVSIGCRDDSPLKLQLFFSMSRSMGVALPLHFWRDGKVVDHATRLAGCL